MCYVWNCSHCAKMYGIIATVLDYDTDYVWNYTHYDTVTQIQFHATLML